MLLNMLTKAQHARRYASVPELLRKLRTAAVLTQRQLGERLGKPQSWVYNCETGNRRVDLAEFCDWCDACTVNPLAALRKFLGTRR